VTVAGSRRRLKQLPEKRALRADRRDRLKDTFDLTVDFDTADAVETLDRFALWADRSRLIPVGPDEALRRLHEHWQPCRTSKYHLDAWR